MPKKVVQELINATIERVSERMNGAPFLKEEKSSELAPASVSFVE